MPLGAGVLGFTKKPQQITSRS
uniref:Uncharacterized protein n=1 Tax=Rhizophora mucronata TaxID=61149 RepID=A0A2P2QSN4_RHIMU